MNEADSAQCTVYEVKSSNHLECLFDLSGLGATHEDFASLVKSNKGTNPHLMIVDRNKNIMSLMDLLKQSELNTQVKNDSEELQDSPNKVAKEEESEEDVRIIKGIIDRKPEYKEKIVLLAEISEA